jgi:excisionase family DNA binding protein
MPRLSTVLAANAPALPAPPSLADLPDVMTVDEVAAVMRVSRKTVYSWIRRGRLACWRQGRLTRITRSQLERFLEGGTS